VAHEGLDVFRARTALRVRAGEQGARPECQQSRETGDGDLHRHPPSDSSLIATTRSIARCTPYDKASVGDRARAVRWNDWSADRNLPDSKTSDPVPCGREKPRAGAKLNHDARGVGGAPPAAERARCVDER